MRYREISENDTIFVKRFKQLIQGQSLVEVSRETKIIRQTLEYWLKNGKPSIHGLTVLANTYNVSIDWLCGIDIARDETAYQRGYKDGYESATKKVVTALMEADR